MINPDIFKAVRIIKKGGLVIYPTETCYGVGVLATSKVAVEKLLKFKKRPQGKAISIAVSDQTMASKYVELNLEAKKIYKQFLPGPVTVISKSRGKVCKELEAEDGTLGVRIPDYKLALELIKQIGEPITATSANSSGKKTPYKIDDIYKNISKKQKGMIDHIIDVGELPHNPPSTIVNTTKHDMQILRRGEIAVGKSLLKKTIKSEHEMIEEGKFLIRKYKNLLNTKCLIVMFNADLGAGKTHFTKGIAKELGIKENVKSPTYSLLNEYQFGDLVKGEYSRRLIHFDAWRLESPSELEKLGIKDHLRIGNIIVVEWAGSTIEYFNTLRSNKFVFAVGIDIDYINVGERKVKIYEID